MKKIIAVLLAVITVVLTFSACVSNKITDEEGNTHVAITEFGGKLKQDKFGNLIEKAETFEGEKVTQPFTYPEILETGRNKIENAWFKIDVPKDWYYDENLSIFRIQHDGKCIEKDKAMCEIQFDSSSTGDVTVLFNDHYSNEIALQLINASFVTDLKKFDTKLFDKEVKAYSCKYSTGSTIYFYAFKHAYVALSIKFIVDDACAGDFSAEEFIKENISLKVFEEEGDK